MINATEFANRDSEDARSQIAFVSNGVLGSKLIDANRNARIAVCNACMEDAKIASDELIRDLYDAEIHPDGPQASITTKWMFFRLSRDSTWNRLVAIVSNRRLRVCEL